MTPGGWIVLVGSVGSVTLWLLWCLWMVFRTPGERERIHGFEFETPDERRSREARAARDARDARVRPDPPPRSSSS
jgi:hypothetical protein